MDTLRSLKVFREVAETGSFTSAAERTGVSLAMASKHVAHLERELRTRLLNRSSRHVSLTEAGRLYYARLREALDTLDGAAAQLADGHAVPQGLLRVTAPVWCATPRFAGLLAAFRGRHPAVTLQLVLTNERVDLVAGGFDLALRGTNEPSPSLIARPIVPVPFHAVASPDCLARQQAAIGRPLREPADLAGIDAILPSYLPEFRELPLSTATGPAAVRVRPVLWSNDTTLAWHATRAGVGAAFLPEWLIEADLADGRLAPLLPDARATDVTLHAAYTSRMYLTPKVRAFIDFVVERLNYHRPQDAVGGTP